jgi:hypothetical protein
MRRSWLVLNLKKVSREGREEDEETPRGKFAAAAFVRNQIPFIFHRIALSSLHGCAK